MKTFFGILFFCGFILSANAQRDCGTVEYTHRLLSENPSLQDSYNKVAEQMQFAARPATNSNSDTDELITIPVIVHVLYNTDEQNISDAQVISQIVALNQDYRRQNADTVNTPVAFQPYAADSKIMFCLAQVDPQGRRTTGIVRKYTTVSSFLTDDAMKYSAQGGDDAWDCTKYLNIWVCNMFGRVLGYAALPGGPADRDGIVVGYNVFGTVGILTAPYNQGRTATHEIGHWLGLIHLWGDADCGSDSVSDTPDQESYNYGCQSFPHLSTCSPNANGDMFMDYMDFSDDGCMNMFTNGQKARMRALFAPGNVRNSFLTTDQCDSNLAEAGPLPDSTTTEPIVTTVQPSVKVYPNPVQSVLNIEFKSSIASPISLNIYNIYGTQIIEKQLTAQNTIIDISDLASGVYVLHIGEGSSESTYKIIHL